MTLEQQARKLGIKSASQMSSAMTSFFIGGGTLLGLIAITLMEMNDMWAEAPSPSVYVVMGIGVIVALIVGISYYSASKTTMDEEYRLRDQYGLD